MSEGKAQGRKAIQVGKGIALVVDSLSVLAPSDAEAVVICAAPCDRESITLALKAHPAAIFLNASAGEGDQDGLSAADEAGIPCATVDMSAAHATDSKAMWSSGKVAALNAAARRRGAKEGMSVQHTAGLLLAWLRVA